MNKDDIKDLKELIEFIDEKFERMTERILATQEVIGKESDLIMETIQKLKESLDFIRGDAPILEGLPMIKDNTETERAPKKDGFISAMLERAEKYHNKVKVSRKQMDVINKINEKNPDTFKDIEFTLWEE